MKVSLIAVNNIMRPKSVTYNVTYCSKCHRLSLSLIAVNEITLIGRPFPQACLFGSDVSQNEQNAAVVLESVRRAVSLPPDLIIHEFTLSFPEVTITIFRWRSAINTILGWGITRPGANPFPISSIAWGLCVCSGSNEQIPLVLVQSDLKTTSEVTLRVPRGEPLILPPLYLSRTHIHW